MSASIHGIHHVTAIGGDPAVNLDFYTRVLGLRLVKRTVNFDDPYTWHLYFGDQVGSPGTAMTFFPHPLARQARVGVGEVALTRFAVPADSLDRWRQRLTAQRLQVEESSAGDQPMLKLQDPHGTRLALIESAGPHQVEPWSVGDVTTDMAIRGFESVRLQVAQFEPTVTFLRDVLGLRELDEPGDSRWFDAGDRQRIEVAASKEQRARLGAGSVHHVAFRVPDDEAQIALRQRLVDAGLNVTDVQERQYFRSIYFREPGGVIIEIATDQPGFAADESRETLGQSLQLPPWLESRRGEIEQSLPPLTGETPS